VVDYRAVEPLPNYLATTYSERPFDVILDTVGIQALYEQSPAYLKPNGVYINVGAFEGVLWTLWCWAKNTLWPSFLGGTPRRYAMFSTVPNGQTAERLAEMVKEGKLRVVVDSVFKMEDVLEVSPRFWVLTRGETLTIYINRLMTAWRAGEQEGRSSSRCRMTDVR
jgi:NADPH:quinone reductase-like Zn-dependent oxidoreductase